MPAHDASLRSWLASANARGCDFPIQNLPLGVFRRAASQEAFRGGVALGDQVVDLAAVHALNALSGPAQAACGACLQPTLNAYLTLGPTAWAALRLALSELLRAGAAAEDALRSCLVAQADAEYAVPMAVGDYTDFYSSLHHATRVGALFRPDAPLLPNYKWLPIAYHGRSSSVVISGSDVPRPCGQTYSPRLAVPVVRPSTRLDYEAELGVVIGKGNALGEPIAIDEADAHVYGLCLLNDWSARDLQSWEYQPLGPFAGKNFATTVSPWLVSLSALAPYRSAWTRAADDPQPLAYLDSAANRALGALDIEVEIHVQTAAMRASNTPGQRISRSNYREAYWTMAQLVAHHTLNGCPLRAGDLLGTGTISGAHVTEAGCLLELTEGGKKPLTLDNGETRAFLEDGDSVVLTAFCERPGSPRIGFGSASGVVGPARATRSRPCDCT